MFKSIWRTINIPPQYYISIFCSTMLFIIIANILHTSSLLMILINFIYYLNVFANIYRVSNISADSLNIVAPIDGIIKSLEQNPNNADICISIKPKFSCGYFLSAPMSGMMKYDIINTYYTVYPFAFIRKIYEHENLVNIISFNFKVITCRTIDISFTNDQLECNIIHKIQSILSPFLFLETDLNPINVVMGQKLFGFHFDKFYSITEMKIRSISSQISQIRPSIKNQQTLVAGETVLAMK